MYCGVFCGKKNKMGENNKEVSCSARGEVCSMFEQFVNLFFLIQSLYSLNAFSKRSDLCDAKR